MYRSAHGNPGSRCGGAHERGCRDVTVAATVRDLRDPLDALILEGQALVERSRLLPFRHIAGLGDCAERLLSLLLDIEAFLDTVAASVPGRAGELGDADPGELETTENQRTIQFAGRTGDDRYAALGLFGSSRSRAPRDPAGGHR